MTRILVIDDEPVIRRGVARALSARGYEIVEAGSGAEGLALAQTCAPDVALVDFHMPQGLDGLQVLHALAEQVPSCARVLMTAHWPDPELWIRAVNDGRIHRSLPKPFQTSALLEAVERALRDIAPLAGALREERAIAEARAAWAEARDGACLRVAFQPIVSAAEPTRALAVECLLRSTHPRLRTPLDVLGAVERAGEVLPFCEVVHREIAAQLPRLSPDLRVFVNVHPLLLGVDDPLPWMAPLLPWASRVVLEVTERAALPEQGIWERNARLLRAQGFEFAVDDLGSGYNGLLVLADLQPAFIKIDMGIVRHIHAHPRKQRLVELVVRFANASSDSVIAEGIETAEEAEVLQRAGVHLFQGYLYGRPSFEVPPVGPPDQRR